MASSAWSCSLCTFTNYSSLAKCEMCNSSKTIDLTLSLSPHEEKEIVPTNKIELKRKRMRQTTISAKCFDMKDETVDGSRKRTFAVDDSFSLNITPALSLETHQSASSLITTSLPFTTDKIEANQVSSKAAIWERALHVLKATFGITTLRSLQPQAIQGALKGESQIVILATGTGKSLCYQLPAIVLPGLTIVISPLIALMVDQVQSLNARGIEAAFISSLDDAKTRTDVLHRITRTAPTKRRNKPISEDSTESDDQRPDIKLLYCTPELIATQRFQSILQKLHSDGRLSLFAIDEAHCISSWGHDFRPSYRKLSWLRSTFVNVPLMACTATATSRVIQDIRDVLCISKTDACLMSSFNRPNISYEVRNKDSMGENAALKDLVSLIKSEHEKARIQGYPCNGIVYVHKRNDTTFIAKAIKGSGISAAPYHAGLKDDQRQLVQEQWTQGSIKVAVATVAFGMGIDLPHVRYVIHWSLSRSIEGFYQESGRGGRDMKQAKSILYFSQNDAATLIFLCQQASDKKNNVSRTTIEDKQIQSIQAVVDYCTTPGCRRKYLLNFFGEKIEPNIVCKRSCDYCINPEAIRNRWMGSSPHNVSSNSHQYAAKAESKITKEWDGQWNRPHNDSSSEDEESPPTKEAFDSSVVIDNACMAKFVRIGPTRSSKDILTHYEALECEAGKSNGFVNFKVKNDSRSRIMGKLKF